MDAVESADKHLLAKKFECSSELKLSWLIVLSQILFIFKSYLITYVICCGRKDGFSVTGASRQWQDRGRLVETEAKTKAGGVETVAVEIPPRGETVPRGTTSLPASTQSKTEMWQLTDLRQRLLRPTKWVQQPPHFIVLPQRYKSVEWPLVRRTAANLCHLATTQQIVSRLKNNVQGRGSKTVLGLDYMEIIKLNVSLLNNQEQLDLYSKECPPKQLWTCMYTSIIQDSSIYLSC